MTAFAFIGVAVTSATLLIYGVAIPNPVDLMARFDSVVIILFATAVIFAAQLTTNMAANVVSPSNDFSNLNPRLISYVTGGLITAVIGILMMPWKLMSSMGAYIFTWLIGYSGLMGAIAGILICDYWVIRKQRLNLSRPSSQASCEPPRHPAARLMIRPSSIACTLTHGSLLLPWDSAYTTF
jgi:NCS1 family nucleobase:cation symporter-1